MTFRVGQKVVCIHDFKPYPDEVHPVRGGVYTVRDCFPSAYFDGMYAVRLEEIVNARLTYAHGVDEVAFLSIRFRPLTDISVFTRMLEQQPVDA